MAIQIDPGSLNKRITIFLKKEGELNENGFPTDSVEEIIRKPWASFSRTSGTEQVKSGKEVTDVKCRFLIRHGTPVLTEDMQIRYGKDDYNILYINDYGDSHEYDEIWCEKVVGSHG